uniref:cAMP response element binding (CREB) protein n=1 Tax=Solanum tuberosum TaxID=4113 RepID=M1DXC6_SOLTU
MDMSSPGLLHSWSSSRFLDEVSPLLHQVSTDVSGYLNVPSLNCGSNLTKGLNNLSDSNKLVHSSPNLGSNLVKDFLYVPRNDTLVKIDGNLIIDSVMESEKAMESHGSAHKKKGEAGIANYKSFKND